MKKINRPPNNNMQIIGHNRNFNEIYTIHKGELFFFIQDSPNLKHFSFLNIYLICILYDLSNASSFYQRCDLRDLYLFYSSANF